MVVVVVGVATMSFAAPTGLWQFDGDLTAQIGGDAHFFAGTEASKVSFSTCSALGISLIGGVDAQVMRFTKLTPHAEAINIPGNLPANGGGAYCNQWTLAMDYCTTGDITQAFSAGYCALWDTNPTVTSGSAGEMFIRQVGFALGAGGQAGGYYDSPITLGTWHRIVFAVDARVGNCNVYVDGVLIGTLAKSSLISTRPDGSYSLYTGAADALALFSSSATNYNGAGYVNSVALWDYPLSSSQIAELGGPSAAGLPGVDPVGDPTLKRHSEFIGYYAVDVKPYDTGDATTAWAIDGTFTGGAFGFYDYVSSYGGSLQLHAPNHNYDHPHIDIDTTGTLTGDVYDPIPVDSDLEAVVEFVPQFTNGYGQYVNISFTDANTGKDDSNANSDVHLKFWSDYAADLWVAASTNPASDGTWLLLDDVPSSVTNVTIITTYEAATTTWRMFYRVDTTAGPGLLTEVPDGPMTGTRTTTAFRVQAATAFGASYDFYDVYVEDVKIYDTIYTTSPEYADGQTLRHSDFDGAPGSGFFDPIGVYHDVDSLFWPTPNMDHDYTSTGCLLVDHDGTYGVNGNCNIGLVSETSMSVELVLDIKPTWPLDGKMQMFNYKFDGSPGSIFVYNDSGNGNGWGMFFGAADPFNPSPSDFEVPNFPADQVTDLRLIINYDAVTQTYGAFYSINGAPVERIGQPFVMARASTNVELQWQVWDSTNTAPFSIALSDFREIYGVQTLNGSTVKDWQMY